MLDCGAFAGKPSIEHFPVTFMFFLEQNLVDPHSLDSWLVQVSITNYPTRDELFARREEEKMKAPDPEPEPEHTEEAQETAHSDADHSGDEHDCDEQENEETEELPLFKAEPDELPIIKVEEPDSTWSVVFEILLFETSHLSV